MEHKEFDARVSRLLEVGKVIEKLPSEIRGEAFNLLKSHVTQSGSAVAGEERTEDHNGGDDEELFTKFNHDRPSDNVRLIAAHFFREYGSEPFSADEVRAMATRVGITIPERVDMTILAAKEDGKQLFARVGRGTFKPTVHGESCLKATYGLKKGTKTRETED